MTKQHPEASNNAKGLAPGGSHAAPERPEVGSRVGAILNLDAGRNTVRFFGYGTYDGDLECPLLDGVPNPRITLENGEVLWGCQCHWGPAEKIGSIITKKGYAIEAVTVAQAEAEMQAEGKKNEEKIAAMKKQTEAVLASPARIDELFAQVSELEKRLAALERKS